MTVLDGFNWGLMWAICQLDAERRLTEEHNWFCRALFQTTHSESEREREKGCFTELESGQLTESLRDGYWWSIWTDVLTFENILGWIICLGGNNWIITQQTWAGFWDLDPVWQRESVYGYKVCCASNHTPDSDVTASTLKKNKISAVFKLL